jgi:biopolymer transport protein ExbD
MALKASKLRRKSRALEPMMEMNTTPLIDVMLVLLVMLIVTIPIQLHSINLEMPLAAPPSTIEKPQIHEIYIDAKSQLFWDKKSVTSQDLVNNLEQVAGSSVQPEIHLWPSKDCNYSVFANVLASTKRLGLVKIAVIGSEQFIK